MSDTNLIQPSANNPNTQPVNNNPYPSNNSMSQPGTPFNPQNYYPYPPQFQGTYPNFVNQPKIDSMVLKQMIDQEIEAVVPKRMSKWFGSIQYRPKRMTFATQDADEKIYVLVRMHWIRNIGWIINNIFYALIPFISIIILQLLNISIEFLSFRVFIIILLAYYSIIFSNVIKNFYDWYYDIYIVTNHRILDYEFSPFQGYKVAEAPLRSLEDVEEQSLGFLADMLNYGTIKVRTASNAGELSFDYIADPTRVRDVIMDLVKIVKRYTDG